MNKTQEIMNGIIASLNAAGLVNSAKSATILKAKVMKAQKITEGQKSDFEQFAMAARMRKISWCGV